MKKSAPRGTRKSLAASAARAKNRALKARFDAAHRDGMAALKSGDYDGLGNAIQRERSIIEEIDVLLPGGPERANTVPKKRRGGTKGSRKRR